MALHAGATEARALGRGEVTKREAAEARAEAAEAAAARSGRGGGTEGRLLEAARQRGNSARETAFGAPRRPQEQCTAQAPTCVLATELTGGNPQSGRRRGRGARPCATRWLRRCAPATTRHGLRQPRPQWRPRRRHRRRRRRRPPRPRRAR